MADIAIDRLSLKLSGLNEAQGRRLATLIGEGLARTPFTAAEPAAQPNLTVNAPADGDIDRLSATIVADIVRQLGIGG